MPSCSGRGARHPGVGASRMKRIASIWLPHLAIERWAKSSDLAPDAPVVLTVEGTHGLIVHAVTITAAERGARPGARLTDVRALDPALVAVPADPEGDAALVQRLARWAKAVRGARPDGAAGDCADRGRGVGAESFRRRRASAAARVDVAARRGYCADA